MKIYRDAEVDAFCIELHLLADGTTETRTLLEILDVSQMLDWSDLLKRGEALWKRR